MLLQVQVLLQEVQPRPRSGNRLDEKARERVEPEPDGGEEGGVAKLQPEANEPGSACVREDYFGRDRSVLSRLSGKVFQQDRRIRKGLNDHARPSRLASPTMSGNVFPTF